VYYVYNRIEDIADVAGKIQRLVPDANVAYAHGQMTEHKLEKIMFQFIEGEIDVLVSTTIIETGLDISNVNTMIIQNADKMGLSQLYQLRGRVGRSNRMAYAFLMYERGKLLKDVSEKRLAAIREFTDLGSGFKIAVRDLEIRGAGSLLGESQSGHMEAIGYDLYCKMLSEAVKKEQGTFTVEESFGTNIDINVDAYIPATYIVNEYQKLDIYKRIAALITVEELDDLIEEIIDRFGDMPRQVETLFKVAKIKLFAHSLFITDIEQKGVEFIFKMYENAPVNTVKIPEFLESFKGNVIIKNGTNPEFIYRKKLRKIRVNGRLMTNPADIGIKEIPLEIVENVLNGIKGLIEK
jgi:transcription-repair coupling factor (superfamily II helicase)